jgi:hypothetical protein
MDPNPTKVEDMVLTVPVGGRVLLVMVPLAILWLVASVPVMGCHLQRAWLHCLGVYQEVQE